MGGVGLGILASCLTLAPAVRVANNHETDLQEGDESAPTALSDGVRESEIRHCGLFHLQAYEDMVVQCELPGGVDAMTLAIENADVSDLLVTAADEHSLMAMNSDENPVDMALCAEGQPFAACAYSLPFLLWLRQFWRYEDMSSRIHLTDGERSKTRIFANALDHRGVAPSRLHTRCAREINQPAFEVVRECVLESVPAFVEQHNYADLMYVSTPAGDIVPVQNKDMLTASIAEWLNAIWRRSDLILGLDDVATGWSRRHCAGERARLDLERTRYQSSIVGAQFPLVGEATQACLDGTPSSLVMSGSLERMVAEMSACGGGVGANCTEQEHPCPEGFMCDCQRNARAGNAFVAGAVLGGVGGLVAATALPFALAGGAGLALTASSETAMAWAMSSLLIGGKAEVAVAGSAAGTQEFSRSCMCFPVECTFNTKSEQCEMVASPTATPSSNPFAKLPSTGLKCTEHHNHHFFSSARVCELSPCEHVDVIPETGSWEGHKLFGRVGRNPDWESGTTIYNCANTQGAEESLLSRISEIPSAEGAAASNTVEGRMAIINALHPEM